MKNNNNNIEKLILKAEIDLKTIDNLRGLPDSPPESICFHAQQAVEKYLKAYLQHLDIKYNPTHDLDYLVKLIRDRDPSFDKYRDIGELLTPYAVSIRYENDDDTYTREEAEHASALAKEIKEIVTAKMK